MIKLRKHQEEVLKQATGKNFGLFWGCGSGKEQPLSSDIYTPTGIIKMKDIKVGDVVLDGKGNPTKVLGVFPQGKKKTYRIFLSDNTSFRVGIEHINRFVKHRMAWKKENGKWYKRTERKVVDIETKDLIEELNKKKTSFWCELPTLQLHNNIKSLPINPYLLGLLLGDGGLKYHVMFSNSEEDIISKVSDLVKCFDCHLIKRGGVDYNIVKNRAGENKLLSKIRDLKLNVGSKDKFIPKEYLYSSVKDRLLLLQGLFDTDGTVDSRGKQTSFSFDTSSKKLSEDFSFLVRSLGLVDNVSERIAKYKKNGIVKVTGKSYRHFIKAPNGFPIASSKKHLSKITDRQNSPMRKVIKIEEDIIEECQCIYVESPEHTYITDNVTVTHNTVAGLALYEANKKLKHNLKLLVVVSPKELIQSAWMNDCDKVGLTDYKSLKDIKDFKKLPDIILTNYEYIRVTKNLLQLKTAIRNSGYPWMLVLDESSKIKNPKTTNFKTIKHISPLCCYRYVMSGTPAPNSETEYWTQMNIISEQPFGKNYYQFRREYFEFTKEYKGKIYKADPDMLRNPAIARGYMQQGYKYTLDPKKKDSFFAVMKPWVSRLETRDVVDLPAETHMERYFHLSPKENAAYKQMRTDMIATVEDKEDVVATDSVLGKMLKLRQVSSGFMYDNTDINNKKCYEFGTSKLNCLMDLLEDIGNNQVVIWATFRQEAEMICKELDKLGKTYTTLNAGTKDKQKAIQDFAENKVQYVIANPQTAAHGITWVNCQYEVFYSMDYSWERYHQAVARIMRLGQTKPCFYYYLLAKGTKDKDILEVIKRKGSLNEIAREMLK